MKLGLFTLFMLACCTSCIQEEKVPNPSGESTTEYLFNGQNFENWNGNLEWFRIEDNVIIAGSLEKPIPQNEFLCTNKEYDDFALHFQTRLIGEKTNAGVQIHTQRIPDHHEVIGYQADIGVGWWGSLYDESRRNTLLATADRALTDTLAPLDTWIDYTVHTQGPRTQLFLGGVQTVDYKEQDAAIPLQGLICLQIHSGPEGEVWYRNIRLEKL